MSLSRRRFLFGTAALATTVAALAVVSALPRLMPERRSMAADD